MKVRVKPVRPIPSILPKNKWIDIEMELDLNKNEILHCMKFGNVYDEDGKLIDALSIKKLSFVQKPINKNIVEATLVAKEDITNPEPIKTEPVKVEIAEEVSIVEEVVEETPVAKEEVVETVEEVSIEETPVNDIEETTEEANEEVVEPYFELVPSTSKEDEYIFLEAKMNTNSVLEGNLYGLFTINSGARPASIEYLSNGNWIKFSNKFANFNIIKNDDKFVFRFVPRSENEFSYRLVIKEANDVLAKLEGVIN